MLFNFKIAAPTHRLQYPFPETRESALPSHCFDKFEIQDTSDSVKMKNHLRIIQYFPSNGQRSRQGHGKVTARSRSRSRSQSGYCCARLVIRANALSIIRL